LWLILLLPRTQLEDAYRIVERIRMAFRSLDFSFLITASIGLAAYPYHAQNKEELLMLADDAMYRAKHQGKDRIKIAKNKLGTV
jgi:diguanylate cyclase (GGDEF)-like protein